MAAAKHDIHLIDQFKPFLDQVSPLTNHASECYEMPLGRCSLLQSVQLQMKTSAVIVGVDLGSWSFKLCAFNGERLEVLTNEANFRETPSLVGYTPTERLIGEPALIKLKTNFLNTIRAPHRLLSVATNPNLLEEELRNDRVAYSCGKDLVFEVEGRTGKAGVAVEEVMLSLLGKVKSIVESHGLALAMAYLSVPTYYANNERQSLLRCAELALGKPVRLVDEWMALAAQYTYNRLKELRGLDEMRHVVFLDIGYSKVALSLVQFSRFEGRLLDWEHLPFTGCRNMDQLLCEHYSEVFQRAHKQPLLTNGKAMVKLTDAVQRQRTVLSANSEHHLSLEYLLNEEDLTYNMHREEFQNIIIPILADIAAAMAALQSRNCSIPLHAVQLMGGASRIPCVQAMAAKIFGMEPSRSLNQSEAIATGCTILGATERKVLNLQYSYDAISTRDVVIRWGQQRHPLFSARSKVPSEVSLNIGNEGMIDARILMDLGVVEKELGRLQFKTPNKLTVSLDENRILRVKVSSQRLQTCQLGQRSEGEWQGMRRREEEMSRMDLRVGMIYEMKNNYESKLYASKDRLPELRPYASPQQLALIEQHIAIAQQWVQEEHSKPVQAEQAAFQQFQQKSKEIATLKGLLDELEGRRQTAEALRVGYDKLSEEISMALELNLSEQGRQRVLEVMDWGQEAYQTMENHNWSSDQLTREKLEEASIIIRSALPK